MSDRKLETHERLAYLLMEIGWWPSCDAQWDLLQGAIPEISELLTGDLKEAATDALSVIEVAASITNSPMIDEVVRKLKVSLG